MARRSIDPRIKLRHITCFLEVARRGSVVAAAEALAISQPAASKTIQELEDILGARLFDRSRRRLVLTPFGEAFYRHAGASLAALRQGIEAAREGNEAAPVRVGALPTVSARLLPRAVGLAAAGGTGHSLIVTGPNAYLLSLLQSGEVDLVIGRMAEPDTMLGLSFEHLYSERVVMAVRPGHPLLAVPRFALGMIETHGVLMPTRDSVIRPVVDRLLVAHGVTGLRIDAETVSDAFGRAYVSQSDAVWIISEGVVAEDVARGQLALLPVDTGETLGPVGLTTRTDTAPTPAALAFMEAVRSAAADVRGG